MIKLATRSCIVAVCMICLSVLAILPFYAHATIELAIETLLVKADLDLAEDRLTQPTSSNAVDRYRAVLLLDKANQHAALGLRNSATRYLELAMSQSLRGAYDKAFNLVAAAESISGQSVKSTAMKQSIKAAQQANRQMHNRSKVTHLVKKTNSLQTVFTLNPEDLSARNENIKSQLATLASRVKESKEYVLIYARNDAEGRWVYQQMRRTTEGYRLRGNIKRHKKPQIVLDSPAD